MNPGWQVYSSVNNAQIQVLSYWRYDLYAGFGLWELLHNQPARVYLQLRESCLQNLGRRGAGVMKGHRSVVKRADGIRAGSVQKCPLPPLPSPSPLLSRAWTWHHDGSGCPLCSIRKTARICQQALSWINSEPENKCSRENVNFKRSGLRALVFVSSTIQHFFF